MRRIRIYHWTGLLVLSLVCMMLAIPCSPTQAISDRPVMAFYYTGYDLGNWSYATMSDRAAPIYSGSDGDAIVRHIEQASDAGIDGFICIWRGPDMEKEEERCERVQDRIEKTGRDMKVAYMPDLSEDSDPELRTVEGLRDAVNHLLNDIIIHNPLYLTFEGKPVVFWRNPNFFGAVEDWRRFRNQVDLNREQFWIVGTDIPALEDSMFAYLDVFDAVYPYDVARHSSPSVALNTYASRLQTYNTAHTTQKPFVATVMPGFDTMRVAHDGYRRDRENGSFYQQSWEAATKHTPDMVVLASFNDFLHGTHIEPSEEYGLQYLDLTKQFIGTFRGAMPAAPPAEGYVQQTGHFLRGVFRSYWERHGGVSRFGYPITEEFVRSSDGKVVQYFERARFELRVLNNNQSTVDLGLLGLEYVNAHGKTFSHVAPFVSTGTRRYFAETGHSLQGTFKTYWEANGGVMFFGYPISEEVQERFPDGSEHTVQYFERARFELHDDTVLVGLLGRALAPCQHVPARSPNAPPAGPLPEGDSVTCTLPSSSSASPTTSTSPSPSSSAPDTEAHGRVYPGVVQPGTVQGFQVWNYAPNEVVSLWLNLPDGSVRELPYKAVADENGYVLIGFTTDTVDPVGHYSMVGQGITSGRIVVAPFELRW